MQSIIENATKSQLKTFVSALRRELKALDKPTARLSHTECLAVMAKALGVPNWNTLEARLKDDSAAAPKIAAPAAPAPATSCRLVNDGRFDFVAPGEEGIPISGRFLDLQGTAEKVYGTAFVSGARRLPESGEIDIEYEGTTDIDWDSQVTIKRQGLREWVTEDGTECFEPQVVLLPVRRSVMDEEELPMREALVQAFFDYFNTRPNTLAAFRQADEDGQEAILYQAEGRLGFAMLNKEREELTERLLA